MREDVVLLEGRNAVVYGGGGAIGGAVARAFAREGARVFLAGRTRERLEEVATDIRDAGGAADTAVVDALDGGAVDAHADAVATQAGRIDVCLNVISHGRDPGLRRVGRPAARLLPLAASRSPSRPSSPCAASSPPSSAATACGS